MALSISDESMCQKLAGRTLNRWDAITKPAISDPSPMLSRIAEDFANARRSEGKPVRTNMLPRTDIYSREGLNALQSALEEALRERLSSDRPESDADDGPNVALIVTILAYLVVTHSARFDWKWDSVANEATNWLDRRLDDGYTSDDFIGLFVAKQAGKVGLSGTSTGEVSKETSELIEETFKIIDLHAEKLKNDDSMGRWNARRLALLMCDAVSAIPSSGLNDGHGSDTRDLVLSTAKGLSKEIQDDTSKGGSSQLASRFQYVAAEMHYASGTIEGLQDAQKMLRKALSSTTGVDLPFIERCQTRLDFFDQEESSRVSNKETITKQIKDDIAAQFEDQETAFKAQMEQVKRSTMEAMTTQMQEESKNSLLRVVEILGVFIAVVGVIGTSIGGVLANETVGQTATIYGIAFVSVILLFGLLRLIVHGPSGFVPRRGDNGRQ